MKVHLRTTLRWQDDEKSKPVDHAPGQVIDLPEDEANRLLAIGAAITPAEAAAAAKEADEDHTVKVTVVGDQAKANAAPKADKGKAK